ncbi:MAG TPA: dodecin family protein [Candidatus Competibacter sp.]|nr:dodecin domain-containing protein [Candidatus Competibacteraceae bacterium]HRC73307.1 dodecin family protein [Candidatus Competibacter sp.]
MAIAKVIEVISASNTSFDDAIRQGIERASDTVSDIQGAWIKDQSIELKDGKISQYKVIMRLTFLVDRPDAEDKRK